MKRYVLFGTAGLLVLAVVAVAVFRGGSSGPAAAPRPRPLVHVEVVRLEALTNAFDLTGTVEPTRFARLAVPAEGPVLEFRVREGDRVTTGQVVARIGRSRAAQASVAAAEENLRREEENLRRTERLVERGALPGEDLDRARTSYEQARAQAVRATEGLGDFGVTVPWNGVVSRTYVAEGDYIAPRATLADVYDPESLVIRCSVPEHRAGALARGMAAVVALDTYPGRTFKARVSRLYGELDRRTRTLTVEISLDDPVRLLPGMFARLSVALSTTGETPAVPGDAIVVTPDGERVAFVIIDGTARRRVVKTGVEERGRVQILGGLAVGDSVVVAGNEDLRDGTMVRVQKARGASAPRTPERSAGQ